MWLLHRILIPSYNNKDSFFSFFSASIFHPSPLQCSSMLLLAVWSHAPLLRDIHMLLQKCCSWSSKCNTDWFLLKSISLHIASCCWLSIYLPICLLMKITQHYLFGFPASSMIHKTCSLNSWLYTLVLSLYRVAGYILLFSNYIEKSFGCITICSRWLYYYIE